MKQKTAVIAEQLKKLLVETSPLIEAFTKEVCPDCTDVCCRQKHGVYRKGDVVYLNALGVPIPVRDETRPPEGPCQFIGPLGCTLPRWMRPFKCTWYFCEPLLAALNAGPPKKARLLSAVLQEMIGLYGELSSGWI